MKRIAVLFLLLPMLLFGGLARAALPTVEQVQAEVKAGRYVEAESMMKEVVAAKPASARARYVYAEILARTGKRDEALKQVAEARRIDPEIGFTDRSRFEQFERTLQSGGRSAGGSAYAGPGTGAIAGPDGATTATRAAPATEPARRAEAESAGSGLSTWLLLGGVVLLAVIAWRFMSARRAAARPAAGMLNTASHPGAAGYPGAYPGAPGHHPGAPGVPGGIAGPGYGYGPGMQPGMAPGRGPGMMGVGLGVAGGLAAGMLAERMLNGNEAQAAAPDAPQGDAAAAGAGLSPGAFDDAGAGNSLRDEPVDFGNGAGWDAAGGDSVDAGSGDEGW